MITDVEVIDDTQLKLEAKMNEHTTDVLHPFDIVIHFNKNGQTLHTDEELKIIFNYFIEKYGEFYLKINWYSANLRLIVPSQQATEALSEAS